MIEPKDVVIDGKHFIISKFDSVAGREIICKYPLSGIPKLGEYSVNEETMLKLMKFVYVDISGNKIPLSTKELINNHTGGWETLVRIEWAMLEYNCSFFQNGRISTFFGSLGQKLPVWISKTLTDLSVQLSQKEKQHSTN